MCSGGEAVDQDGASPTPENVEQGEARPRKSNNVDVVAIVKLGFESVCCMDANTVVGGDLVPQTDDDEWRWWERVSSRDTGNSEAPRTKSRCRRYAARCQG
jgi:hypothetical protein